MTIKNNIFCIYSHDIAEKVEFQHTYLKNGIYSSNPVEEFDNIFIFFTGIIYNIFYLQKKFSIKNDNIESIIVSLYKKFGYEMGKILDGAYSIVIVEDNHITLFRDRDGLENLYYYKKNNSLLISNSIKEIKKVISLDVNFKALPNYFILSQINGEQTYFEDIYKLKPSEVVRYNSREKKWESLSCGHVAYVPQKIINLKDKEILLRLEDILTKRIRLIIKAFPQSKIYNSLSGGVDSSLTQCILQKFGFDSSYCINFLNYGKDGEYSLDIANYLKLDHKVIEIDSNIFYSNIENGILIAEKPLIFGGEAMLNYMYKIIRKNEKNKNNEIICFDSNGADALLGSGRALKAIKFLTSAPKLSYICNELVVKFISKKYYKMLKDVLKAIDSNKLVPDFYFSVFNLENNLETIKKALMLSNLYFVPKYEVTEGNKYKLDLIEKIYRLEVFESHILRENNINYQLAKAKNIALIFPFRDTEIIKFFIAIPTTKKIKFFSDKYYGKKLASKFFPAKFVYRKKYGKRIPFLLLFQKHSKFKSIIEEIKDAKYAYFDWDYDKIFAKKEFEGFALKLINFHIWNKLFIQN